MTEVQQPNVVLMHCHDLGRCLGCYGVETVRTPNLDAFAAQGVQFMRSFCTAPQCSPSRAALFTGRYPHVTGVLGLSQAPFEWDMTSGERHLAALLGKVGYESVLVGVHHESRTSSSEVVAAQLGFDVVQQRGQRGEDVTALALAQLTRLAAGNRPFYLQLGYLEPHRLHNRTQPEDGYLGFIADYIEPDDSLGVTIPPYLLDEPSARVELAELQGAVMYLDQQIGAVLRTLTDLGLGEETIVIFTTDHGLALPRAKCSLYDAGLETALMMRWPAGGWIGGVSRDDLVSNVDLVPTLLEACGIEAPDKLHGVSLGPVPFVPADGGRREIFGEFTYHTYYDPRRCIRTDRYKLIANFTVAGSFMDCSSSWRPRCRPIGPSHNPAQFHPPFELYDLEHDPLETINVADDPEWSSIRADLVERLSRWMYDTKDPLLNGPVAAPLHEFVISSLASDLSGAE